MILRLCLTASTTLRRFSRASHAGNQKRARHVLGGENSKILPRRKTIFVIHSHEEASGYRCVMQYNLSLASALADTPQKWFDGVGWRFLNFRGGASNSA